MSVNPKVAKNFWLSEFKCPCCGEVRINNDLPVALQELRDLLGSRIIITSAYRCKKHNEEIGGAKFSAHIGGYAADCFFPGVSLLDAYLCVVQCLPWTNRGGLGLYPDRNFIHLDVRKKKTRWGQLNGEYVPFADALLELKGSEK